MSPAADASDAAERELATEAIAPLATLPVFFKLAGKKAVVAGGSEAAAWKAELLAAAGAKVGIFSPAPCRRMIAVAAGRADARIERRNWRPEDLAGAAIAVGDFTDPAESRAFSAAGRAAGAPVNVIDQPEFCDFSFGAIVNRSPLVIGVSTDGAAPVFGQALRGRLEALIPQGFAAWAAAAESWRDQVQALGASFRRRRSFWERFAALALAKADRPPSEDDREALLAQAAGDVSAETGEAVFVCAGSGGADLLTLRAWRALQSADAIVFDDRVPAATLDLARREAERIKARAPADNAQAIVALCRAGKKVVRFRGGVADLDAQSDDEIGAVRRAGISWSIIPGVSEAAAAAGESRL
ncbi:MAG TPA: siroheme synthase [Roseiarcus sp.]|nr:siroheme synthase [Roseiarcus sp.]